eukprot:gene629-1812_t
MGTSLSKNTPMLRALTANNFSKSLEFSTVSTLSVLLVYANTNVGMKQIARGVNLPVRHLSPSSQRIKLQTRKFEESVVFPHVFRSCQQSTFSPDSVRTFSLQKAGERRFHQSRKAPVHNCDKSKSRFFCKQCAAYLCHQCNTAIHAHAVLKRHTQIDATDFSASAVD